MALKFGTTTVNKIVFNNVDLDKVYFNNGTTNTLVFAKPLIFTGGNGSQIFNMWVGQRYGTNMEEREGGGYASADTTTMSATMRYDTSSNIRHIGLVKYKTKTAYDISLYSTATLKVDLWSQSANHGVYLIFRPTTSSDVSEAAYLNNGYTSGYKGYTTTRTEYTFAINLATIKESATQVYFQIWATADRASGTQSLDSYMQVKSITLS